MAGLAPLTAPFGKDPLREYRRIEPGRYLVTEPITITHGLDYVGGQPRYTRGFAPIFDLRGVTLVVSPDFKGDRVLDIVGCKPIIEGLAIDARWAKVKAGVVFRALVNPHSGKSEASGARGSWRGGVIVGCFTDAALVLSSAEEINFELSITNEGSGVGVLLENGGAYGPPWSQTCVNFRGCTVMAYGGDCFRVVGDVNDTVTEGCFLASPHSAVNASAATGKRNLLSARFEGKDGATVVRGTGWTKERTVLSPSPGVSAWTARGPLPANTLSRVGLVGP